MTVRRGKPKLKYLPGWVDRRRHQANPVNTTVDHWNWLPWTMAVHRHNTFPGLARFVPEPPAIKKRKVTPTETVASAAWQKNYSYSKLWMQCHTNKNCNSPLQCQYSDKEKIRKLSVAKRKLSTAWRMFPTGRRRLQTGRSSFFVLDRDVPEEQVSLTRSSEHRPLCGSALQWTRESRDRGP